MWPGHGCTPHRMTNTLGLAISAVAGASKPLCTDIACFGEWAFLAGSSDPKQLFKIQCSLDVASPRTPGKDHKRLVEPTHFNRVWPRQFQDLSPFQSARKLDLT